MYLRTAVVPLVALGIALAPGGGAAQDGRPVPAELVRALFTGWMEGPLVVGELPEGFPAGAVPPGSRVLGGYAGARTATAAVVVPAAPDSALAAYRARMAGASGWRFRPEPEPVSQGGFVASVAGSRSGGTTFCGEGGATLSAVAFPREEGGSYLRITLDRDRRSSYCTAAGTPRPHETADDVPFPELRPPARATVRPRGSGSSSSEGRVTERSSAALVEGSLGAAALAAHYTGEMRRAGWSMAEPVAGEAAALATGSLRDARGRSWRAVLTAVSRSADELDLTLRVLRLEDEES